jgi:phospholipid/cholesterol/gamma-HCH transport system ATP-binding protein
MVAIPEQHDDDRKDRPERIGAHDAARDRANQPQADDSSPLVTIENLSVRFGRNWVLRDINLVIPRGQTVALLGESGCGKTVLMKTIIGLVKPVAGRVIYDGRDLASLNEREITSLRTRFGFVFQQAALFDSMTIEQNVAFPLRQHTDKGREERKRLVMQRLAEVGLPDNVCVKKPAELSGGMRKRVGLARALALNPEIMLYDEPTTGLDPIMSDVINELILRVRRQYPVTSIVVTHDMHSARKIADRVVMLYPQLRLPKGEPQVIYDGPPEGMEKSPDKRVVQFVRGEAGERLMEMRERGVLTD